MVMDEINNDQLTDVECDAIIRLLNREADRLSAWAAEPGRQPYSTAGDLSEAAEIRRLVAKLARHG
jgi:hypothetical protein